MVRRSCSTNLAKTNFSNSGTEGNPAEEIPGGDHVDAALIARDGRDGGERRKPVLPGADGFPAQVGQNEVDGRGDGVGVGVEAQKLVGRAVGAGRVRAHAESVGESARSFSASRGSVLRAPPPGLMNERAVRGIHEADDAVVDAAGQVGGEVGELVVLAEFWNLGAGVGAGAALVNPAPAGAGSGMKTQMKSSRSSHG
jgi:hypothetical protein